MIEGAGLHGTTGSLSFMVPWFPGTLILVTRDRVQLILTKILARQSHTHESTYATPLPPGLTRNFPPDHYRGSTREVKVHLVEQQHVRGPDCVPWDSQHPPTVVWQNPLPESDWPSATLDLRRRRI